MRVVYFGTASFAVPALRALAPHCLAVVTQPARPTGRGLPTRVSPVEAEARDLGLPVLAPEKARGTEFVQRLEDFEADLFVVAAYGQILRQPVLAIPHRGCFNLHGSLLPRWRGAAPVQRAIAAGDHLTGVTLMRMDEGMDTGPIVALQRTVIGPDETAGELMTRLADVAASMIAEWAPRLTTGDFTLTPQDESSATHAAKLERGEGQITLGMEASRAYDLFRAMTPGPGAWFATASGPVKLTQARLMPDEGEPGTLLSNRPELVVSLKGGSLCLLEVQPEGRRRMSGHEYANGARLATGARWIVPEPPTGP